MSDAQPYPSWPEDPKPSYPAPPDVEPLYDALVGLAKGRNGASAGPVNGAARGAVNGSMNGSAHGAVRRPARPSWQQSGPVPWQPTTPANRRPGSPLSAVSPVRELPLESAPVERDDVESGSFDSGSFDSGSFGSAVPQSQSPDVIDLSALPTEAFPTPAYRPPSAEPLSGAPLSAPTFESTFESPSRPRPADPAAADDPSTWFTMLAGMRDGQVRDESASAPVPHEAPAHLAPRPVIAEPVPARQSTQRSRLPRATKLLCAAWAASGLLVGAVGGALLHPSSSSAPSTAQASASTAPSARATGTTASAAASPVAGPDGASSVVPSVPASSVPPVAGAAATMVTADGTYRVGKDLRPGKYRAAAPDSGRCAWSRQRTQVGGVIASGATAAAVTVTVRATDGFFVTAGCATWRRIG